MIDVRKMIRRAARPFVPVTRPWAINLSVAAMAVGLFQESAFGLMVGAFFYLLAYALDFWERRD